MFVELMHKGHCIFMHPRMLVQQPQLSILEFLSPQHAQEYGVVPVLYASTWLLTAFACPFPPAFSGRVIDVMLTEGRTHVLLRAALAVMLSCQEDLLALLDFEALITHLKVGWSDLI